MLRAAIVEQLLARLGLRSASGRPARRPAAPARAGRRARAKSRGRRTADQLAAVEQVLEHDLAVVPVPPAALLADALLEVGGGDRAARRGRGRGPRRRSRGARSASCGRSPSTGGRAHLPAEQPVLLARARSPPRGPSTRTARRRRWRRRASSRGCGPRRANSGSSWLRTSTFTESTWITLMRSNTRRRWRRSTRPVGRRSAKPWAAERRAWRPAPCGRPDERRSAVPSVRSARRGVRRSARRRRGSAPVSSSVTAIDRASMPRGAV